MLLGTGNSVRDFLGPKIEKFFDIVEESVQTGSSTALLNIKAKANISGYSKI